MRDDPNCTCSDDSYDFHTCPFQEDVNDDSEYTCNCCSHCEHECAMDI